MFHRSGAVRITVALALLLGPTVARAQSWATSGRSIAVFAWGGRTSPDLGNARTQAERETFLINEIEREVNEGGQIPIVVDLPAMGDFKDANHALIGIRYGLNERVFLDLEATYIVTRSVGASQFFREEYRASGYPITITGVVRYPVPGARGLYLVGGAGGGWLFDGTWTEESINPGFPEYSEYTGTGPVGQGLLGCEYVVGGNLGFGLEARYRYAIVKEVQRMDGHIRYVDTTTIVRFGPQGTGAIALVESDEKMELDFSGWQISAGVRYYFPF